MQSTIDWKDKYNLIKFILFSDRFTNGEKVREFESAWSTWLNVKHSLYVSSGSTANFLLLAAVKEMYNIPNGSKVLVPACTWVTNVSPVLQLGLKPVFSDISLEHFSFDTDSLKIDCEIKIVFITHLMGFDAPVELLKKTYPNAIFIEDICESHGVRGPNGERRGGSSSLGSTFSFYYGHHMTTIEGGMISTNNKELYELMRIKRSHGLAREMSPDSFEEAKKKYPEIDPRFLFMTDGYNFRNTELGAVLGLSQLKKLDASIHIRQRNYAHFINKLKNFEKYLYIPDASPRNSNFVFPIICKDPDVMQRLKTLFHIREIENRPIVAGNLLRQPFLKDFSSLQMKNADILNYNGVYIGNNQFVTLRMIDELVNIIEQIVTPHNI